MSNVGKKVFDTGKVYDMVGTGGSDNQGTCFLLCREDCINANLSKAKKKLRLYLLV